MRKSLTPGNELAKLPVPVAVMLVSETLAFLFGYWKVFVAWV
ncbi:hypothetical protein [Microcoleus sp. w2-18aC6]